MLHGTGDAGPARSKLALMIVLQPSAKQNLYPIEPDGGSAARLARCDDRLVTLLGRSCPEGCFKPKAVLWWSRRIPFRSLAAPLRFLWFRLPPGSQGC